MREPDWSGSLASRRQAAHRQVDDHGGLAPESRPVGNLASDGDPLVLAAFLSGVERAQENESQGFGMDGPSHEQVETDPAQHVAQGVRVLGHDTDLVREAGGVRRGPALGDARAAGGCEEQAGRRGQAIRDRTTAKVGVGSADVLEQIPHIVELPIIEEQDRGLILLGHGLSTDPRALGRSTRKSASRIGRSAAGLNSNRRASCPGHPQGVRLYCPAGGASGAARRRVAVAARDPNAITKAAPIATMPPGAGNATKPASRASAKQLLAT